jgi:3-oxoacyl-[acyl-carrier-protein] synthase-3
MIGIKAIGAYIPAHQVDNYKRTEILDTDADFIKNKIGFESLSRKLPDEETSDLCVKAFYDLQTQTDIQQDSIDCIIVCTQNPDGAGLPHTSAIVQNKLNLGVEIASFDISLGCSGFVYGISILQAFMTQNGLKSGLLFTSDPYSKVLDNSDRDTELLFGDAATCTWITEEPKYLLLKSRFATDGRGSNAIIVDKHSSLLSMIGKDVFMFTMKCVPPQIENCLKDNALSKDDIALFILHQGSKYIIDNLTKTLQVQPETVPFEAGMTGNTVSSSIPLILKEHLDLKHEYILLSGFGVGLSWATTVIQSNR